MFTDGSSGWSSSAGSSAWWPVPSRRCRASGGSVPNTDGERRRHRGERDLRAARLSTARRRAFAAASLELWYGGGVLDLRDATLAPEGATLKRQGRLRWRAGPRPGGLEGRRQRSGARRLTGRPRGQGLCRGRSDLVIDGHRHRRRVRGPVGLDADEAGWLARDEVGVSPAPGISDRRLPSRRRPTEPELASAD